MTRISIISLLLFSLLYGQQVTIHGALKSAMQGDIEAKFDLRNLQAVPNVYGLGAVENLKGEITIIDSKPFVSFVNGDPVFIDSTMNHKAALFTYSNVKTWQILDHKGTLDSDSLNKLLAAKAGQGTIPLTIVIEGMARSLSWHVIDWADGDTVHTHQKHKTSGKHGTLENERVIIVGFYSRNHRGVLTHRGSNWHLHFVTRDKRLAGHVDDLLMQQAIVKIAYETD